MSGRFPACPADDAVTRVYVEIGRIRVFAGAVDWPGWCRSGRSEELALATLASYAPRYGAVAARAGLGFEPTDPVVVERVPGDATTDFGAPGAVPAADAEPLDPAAAHHQAALVQASWAVLAEVAATVPEVLRKGPRGGGRDRDAMLTHVVEAERSYARKIGVRHRPFPAGDGAALAALRADVVAVLGAPSDGTPVVPRGWPVRYAARRIAWHVLDHAWEMVDRVPR